MTSEHFDDASERLESKENRRKLAELKRMLARERLRKSSNPDDLD